MAVGNERVRCTDISRIPLHGPGKPIRRVDAGHPRRPKVSEQGELEVATAAGRDTEPTPNEPLQTLEQSLRRWSERQIYRGPSSSVGRLTQAFCRSAHASGYPGRVWTALPSRLGKNAVADLAAVAHIKSAQYIKCRTSENHKSFRASYDVALRALQSLLRRRVPAPSNPQLDDEILLAVTVLTLTHHNDAAGFISHMRGAGALVSTRRFAGTQPSELVAVSVYYNWIAAYADPFTHGLSSPFDRCQWFGVDPARCHGTEPDTFSLRKLSFQLLIRLPRLVALVRELRGKERSARSATFETAINLAEALLVLEDSVSENVMLHRLRVCKTPHAADSLVVPMSFQFPDNQSFEAAVTYWQARILLNRLIIKLCALQPPDQPPANIFSGDLSTQNVRYASNILMTLHYVFKVGRQPGVFLFFGIVALWGVVQDCGQKLGRTATSLLRPLIRRAYYELVLTHYGARYEPDRPTVAVMDEAAELLVGGPLSGLLVDMFQ